MRAFKRRCFFWLTVGIVGATSAAASPIVVSSVKGPVVPSLQFDSNRGTIRSVASPRTTPDLLVLSKFLSATFFSTSGERSWTPASTPSRIWLPKLGENPGAEAVTGAGAQDSFRNWGYLDLISRAGVVLLGGGNWLILNPPGRNASSSLRFENTSPASVAPIFDSTLRRDPVWVAFRGIPGASDWGATVGSGETPGGVLQGPSDPDPFHHGGHHSDSHSHFHHPTGHAPHNHAPPGHSVIPVPEPASLPLLGLGMIALGVLVQWRKRAPANI